MIFNSTDNTVKMGGVTLLNNPETGDAWVDESEAQAYASALVVESAEAIAPEPIYDIHRLVNIAIHDTTPETTEIAAMAGMYPLNENQVYKMTGNIIDANDNPVLFSEEIKAALDIACVKEGANGPVDQIYLTPILDDFGNFELDFKLPTSGNWMITAVRQNEGLAFLNVDFRFEFADFDIKCRQVIS